MKAFFLIICFCIAFVSVDFGQTAPKVQKTRRSKAARKAPRNVIVDLANVSGLHVSHSQISTNCPADDDSCSAKPQVKIATTAPEVEASMYVYTVSGGKIVGSGANVIWDLSGVEPGEYTITAGIDTGTGWGVLGQTRTRWVRVLDRPDH
jgi:hypothetical protein